LHTYSNDQNTWNVHKLWEAAKDLPIKWEPLDKFAGVLDECVWVEPNQPVTVREIMEHCIRIQKADLDFPIILSASGELMDGVHRIAKAVLKGHSVIQTVRFKIDPPPLPKGV